MALRIFLINFIVILLCSCGSEERSAGIENESKSDEYSLLDIDLSGTWRVDRAEDIYNKNSGEYLYTIYSRSELSVEDTVDGIRYGECWRNSDTLLNGSKNFDVLLLNPDEVGFSLVSRNELVRRFEFTPIYDQSVVHKSTEKMVRIGYEAGIDGGNLSIIGENISVTELNNVCYFYMYDSSGTEKFIEIYIPYQSDRVALQLAFRNEIVVGHYSFDPMNIENQLFKFDVWSLDPQFVELFDSNLISPNYAELNITHVDDSLIQGIFSFEGSDFETYNGDFSIQLP